MIQRPLLHMTAAPILGGGGMAWKVLASPLAQVCIYFIVSIFFFFFQLGFLLKDVFVAFVIRQKRQKCLTMSIVMFYSRNIQEKDNYLLGPGLGCHLYRLNASGTSNRRQLRQPNNALPRSSLPLFCLVIQRKGIGDVRVLIAGQMNFS